MLANPAYITMPYVPHITGNSFNRFYPFYLGEHSNKTCRRLHIIGTTCVVGIVATSVLTSNWSLLLAAPVAGYGFAWIGHFWFEKNRPATFKHPLYSLAADFKMWSEVMTGKRAF